MLPAQQSLKAGNFPRSKRYDRLIEIPKFLPFEGAAQVGLQLQASHYTRAHICIEYFVTGLAKRLCPVHSGVSISQDFFVLLVGGITQSNSDSHRRKLILSP